ncbi:hypothetical protein AMELA_G00150950 [Ameiurus melas]|uniref:Uncharacterized protein n=1 Tax=Ameiurus melas TaxID=219545 RepID=A0A7J6ALL3_AMEME|nr:hypothetical protein AMELA_G00150950 [Ameiurus melas]
MNGAILDFNLLLGKVAEMVFISCLHVWRRRLVLRRMVVVTWSGLTPHPLLPPTVVSVRLSLWIKKKKDAHTVHEEHFYSPRRSFNTMITKKKNSGSNHKTAIINVFPLRSRADVSD